MRLGRKADPAPLGDEVMKANRDRLATKKKFTAADYETLVEPWVEGRSVYTLAEAIAAEAT